EIDHMLLLTALNTSAIRYAIDHGMPPEIVANYDDIYNNTQHYNHTGGSTEDFPQIKKTLMQGLFPKRLAGIVGEFPREELGDTLCGALCAGSNKIPHRHPSDLQQMELALGQRVGTGAGKRIA
ncbi:MAG: hypothetical protein ACOYNL_05805, partial [Rickettsiales bacterium]